MSRKNRVRYTNQQEQEDVSRGQLQARLTQYGWPIDSIGRDLGEDFIVRIYDAGIYSGLAFYVQLKSTVGLESLARQDNLLRYPISASDLEHWSTSAIPVFIIIWDIRMQCGCWVSVADSVGELSARKAHWRSQRTVRIRVPRSNATDNDGLAKVRLFVAHHYYPSISQGKELTIETKFEFPRTPEGSAAFESVQRAFRAGEKAIVDGRFIRELRFSEWWTRLFGEIDPTHGQLTLTPVPPNLPVPARIDVIARNGLTATLQYVDLRVVRQGTEEVTLSNEHQLTPLHFQLVLKHGVPSLNLTVHVLGPGNNVEQSRDVLRFLNAFAHGGTLRLHWLTAGNSDEIRFASGLVKAPDSDYLTIVDKLCYIQQKTGQMLVLQYPNGTITGDDRQSIHELLSIFETGRVVYNDKTVTGYLPKVVLDDMVEVHLAGRKLEFWIQFEDSYVELLGVQIALGPMTRHYRGMLDAPLDEFERNLSRVQPDGSLNIRLVHADVIEEFTNWVPEHGEKQPLSDSDSSVSPAL
jgi:hypothetical protein